VYLVASDRLPAGAGAEIVSAIDTAGLDDDRSTAGASQGACFLGAYFFSIAELGVKDTACVDACPVDCIHPKKDESEFEDAPQLYIDPQEGIDCGACVPVCPVSAILALDDLPTQGSQFAQINQEH
jgi:NAD-dependent dihydropyrimidine dehydrogenase PreA subunit